MKSRVGGSYSYNVVCPVCGFNKKNTEMKLRWDGIWVCEQDWEPRHPMDFYKTRNDTHLLPFVYPNQTETTSTPVFTNRTVGGTGVTDTAQEKYDSINSKSTFWITITPVDSTSYTTTASAYVTLPRAIVTDGTLNVFTKSGIFLGTGAITGGVGNLPNWTGIYERINIVGTYGA